MQEKLSFRADQPIIVELDLIERDTSKFTAVIWIAIIGLYATSH